MRWIVALGIVIASCFVVKAYSPHHEGANVFETLYYHLIPAPLVKPAAAPGAGEHGEHGEPEPLLEIPLPAALAFLDYRGHMPAGEGPKTVLFNLQVFQVAAILLGIWCFLGVPRYLRTGRGDQMSRMFAGWAMWIRDEMVYPVMGKKMGRRFLPYFLCVFFFIMFMNVMGLVPFSVTATASIFVTGALALTTLVAILACGMIAQGPIAFWKNLVPHVPLVLWPLMFFVEVLGLLVKPFALMIRLFANMNGGHMVVLSFMGLIFYLARPEMWGVAGGWGAVPIGIGFAVFIMIIEAFVALLQAYIFTQLSIIFVNASIHPEH
ncbi:MAG: F0F1 ATP synthase subunit A [Planctomycetota bacterium]